MQYFLCLISVALYLSVPNDAYSLPICIVTFILFVISAIWGIYRMKSIEFFGFNLLFTLSFFGCCYIFPIFIYTIDTSYSIFEFGYDPKVITKSTCLATVAYTCYICGLLRKIGKVVAYKKNGINERIRIVAPDIPSNGIFILSLLFLLLFITSGGYNYLSSQYTSGVTGGGIMLYFYALVSILPILLSYVLNCQFSIKNISIAIFVVLIFLFVGSRTLPLALILGAFYVYSLQHKVSNVLIITFLVIGLFVMSFIGMYRGGEKMDVNADVGFWNIFVDLVINNRNLFDAYSIVDKNGVVPTVFLGPILAAIPMSQSFFVNLTGVPDYTLNSASYFTINRLGSNPSFGLGTNIVGDVFLGGGLLAVIILFYLLGGLITKSLYKIHVEKNLTWYVLYVSLVTSGIYICRGPFFWFVRSFVWTIIIFSILKFIVRYLKRHISSSYR